MSMQRVSGSSSLVDVLDRVLDKGIVMDAWARISLAEIDLGAGKARLTIAQADGRPDNTSAGGRQAQSTLPYLALLGQKSRYAGNDKPRRERGEG
jgi:gas vesicle structural protein